MGSKKKTTQQKAADGCVNLPDVRTTGASGCTDAAHWFGDTGSGQYINRKTATVDCKDNLKQIEKKCRYEESKSDEKDDLFSKERKKVKKNRGQHPKYQNWKKKHCDGLNIKPSNKEDTQQQLKDFLEDIEKAQKEALAQLEIFEEVRQKVKTEIAKQVAKQGGKVVAKAALKGWLGPIGWAWTAYDVYNMSLDVKEMDKVFDDIKATLEEHKKLAEKLPEDIKKIKEQGVTQESMADIMSNMAVLKPCARARRCLLVPFKTSKQIAKKSKSRNSGCCPGQTAHHLIPKSYFGTITHKTFIADKSICGDYDEDKAPCICVEGVSQNHGSHGTLHDSQDKQAEHLIAKNGTNNFTLDSAVDSAVKAHAKTFPGNCDSGCIKKQLEKYHQDACKTPGSGNPDNLRAVNKQGAWRLGIEKPDKKQTDNEMNE